MRLFAICQVNRQYVYIYRTRFHAILQNMEICHECAIQALNVNASHFNFGWSKRANPHQEIEAFLKWFKGQMRNFKSLTLHEKQYTIREVSRLLSPITNEKWMQYFSKHELPLDQLETIQTFLQEIQNFHRESQFQTQTIQGLEEGLQEALQNLSAQIHTRNVYA